ncbi:MAG: hypothetical protein NVSMB2_07450 [Chloroflexota bacterium]
MNRVLPFSVSALLIRLGCLLVGAAFVLVAVDAFLTWQHQTERTTAPPVPAEERSIEAAAALQSPLSTAEPTVESRVEVPVVIPTVVPTQTPQVSASLVVRVVQATATVEPTPAAPPDYGPAVWMAIPKIGVDERISEVGVQGSEYGVPNWDIGHHQDSANPGEPGNSIFNGHLTTLSAGKVFARLRELLPGDTVLVYTRTHILTWTVNDVFTTDNEDISFLQPTDGTRITLYTCDGRLIPLRHDYSDRFVVLGELTAARDRDPTSAARPDRPAT